MSASPTSKNSVEPEDQTSETFGINLDLDAYVNNSSRQLPSYQDGTASTRRDTRTNTNVPIDDDGRSYSTTLESTTTSTRTSTTTSTTTKTPMASANSSTYGDIDTRTNEPQEEKVETEEEEEEEEEAADFRSFHPSPLLPALSGLDASAQNVPPAAAGNAHTKPSPEPTEIFSIEMERAEIESLTVDEILDAERDLTGLSSGLEQMSLHQRNDQKELISPNTHDATNIATRAQIHEDPISSSADLAALDLALLVLPPERKRYYLEACVLCPAEVSDERKGAFLETDQLDASAAASRLCTYWTVRVETFGTDLAFLPMTLHGAMREDVDDMIRYCPLQRLPKPDSFGRQMTFWDSKRRNFQKCTMQQELRGMFYLVHTMTLDPTSRRRGWVAIATGKNLERSNFSWETTRYLKALYSTVMPIKLRSCHVSHPSNVLYYGIYPVIKGLIGRQMRLRWKLYPSTTTDEELMDQLAIYGIPRSRLPVDIGGELRLDFEQFIADYSVLESLSHMDDEEKKSKKPAAAATDAPIPSSLSSLLSHPQLLSTSTKPVSVPTRPNLPSTADDMLTAAALGKAASSMNVMQPPPFTDNPETNVARTKILSKFNSQLLMAGNLARSRRPSSSKDDDASASTFGTPTGGKPLALLATTLSTPEQPTAGTNTTNSPWPMQVSRNPSTAPASDRPRLV